ncbi:MAG: ActS/PrrB/RegB family redox-sensitive histidine kinase, partial [Pseudomonadota bacterium]
MPGGLISQVNHGGEAVRLDTLVRVRWLAVAGQSAAVLGVRFGLGFEFPAVLCFALIACSALVNIVLKARWPGNLRLTETQAAWLLAYDVIQLSALLYLTGGLENPFSFLLLAPVMVSATVLPPRKTLLLGLGATVAATVLAVDHWPLPWYGDAPPKFPVLYVASVWVALLLSIAFMGVYGFRVADEARKLADALSATELVLVREQHLNALDGLAAAAAHELGTPLSTIALVSKELETEIPADSPWRDDVLLLRSQSERCRAILAKLRSLSGDAEHPFAIMSLSQLIEELV